jgi:2-oxoglutarate ferredoxin oxidoreductase subunit gamma
MKDKNITRGEVILAGSGGGGVKSAGEALAAAASLKYKNVTCVPFYSIAKRGGLSESTVIFSDQEIASPLLAKAEVLVMLDSSQLKSMEARVAPGGLLILERDSIKEPTSRKDVRVMVIPAVETAYKLGFSLGASFVLIGAYVEGSKAIDPELIEKEIERRFAGKDKAIKMNKEAFRQGMKLAASAK